MTTRLQRSLLLVTRQLWFRAGMFSLVAVGAALLAKQVDGYLPADMPFKVSPEAVTSILGALASSMLAVTIFSLSTLVSALAAATSGVTPRARGLLQGDRAALNALSTFLGAFLFSLVGMIALQTGYYGERGRLVLFVATLGMVAVVVVTLVRWIDHVSSLGGVTETAERIEEVAAGALADRARRPYLGAQPFPGATPQGSPVLAPSTGYLQHVDAAKLQAIAEERGARIYVLALPGTFLTTATRVAIVEREAGEPCDDGMAKRIRAALTVAHSRSFDQDPRFGLLVLSEIASRALSPAVNDPGTAIGVIGRSLRLLLDFDPARESAPEFDRVFAPAIDPDDLVTDAFAAIARDGASNPDVGLRLQKALHALVTEGATGVSQAAARLSTYAMLLARDALQSLHDMPRLADVADAIARDAAARHAAPGGTGQPTSPRN